MTNINTITAYDQLEPAITVLADGTTVIVWTSQTGTGNGFDVMARMFDADGVALGDEFVVNANAVGDQTQPDVQALSTGGFVVAWTGGNQILTRTYDASGSALNTDVSVGANGSVLQNAHLSAFDDGSYVVAWEAVDTADVYLRVVSSNGQFASIVGGYASGDNETLEVAVLDNNTIGLTFERSGVIYASVLNPDITNTAGAFTLNVPGSAGSLPSIAALSDGGFVVTWHTDNGVGTAHDIKAQIINADSTVRSSILDVNTTTLHDQEVSEVVGLSGGGFVVVWQSSQGGLDVTDPNADYDIMARIFDANGVEVVGEFRLNDQTANVQSLPDIAATADGGFTVTWQTNDGVNDPDGFGIVSRSFDANGVAVDFGGSGNGGTASSGEAIVNTITDYDQLEPSITVLADGTKVIVWTTETVTEDRIDVMARMFDANGVALGDEFVVNANVVGDRTEPDVQALSTGGFVVGWTNVDSAGSHIITRVFDASGTATSGEMEIGSAIGRFSDLGALDNGHYVVAWELADERADVYLAVFDGDGQIVSTVGGYTAGDNDTLKVAVLDNNTIGLTFERSGVIYASVLNPDITNTAGAFTLNVPAVDGAGSLPSLAALSDGGFVVTWHAETGSGVGANNDVKAQIINADSTLRSGILDVNTTLIHDQEASKVAGLSDGGFVVVWQSSQGGLDVTDPNADYDIMARIFDANGVEVVGEFRLNDQTTNVQSLPDIAATADGGFTVTWQTNDGVNDPDGFGIVSRTFDADGVAVDAGGSNNNGGTNGGGTQPSETASNTITAYDQLEPAITVLADGTTVIVWTSQTGTGNGFDVMARMFDADGVALGDEFVVNANAVGDQTQPDVQALSTGGFVVAWTGGNQILTRTYDASGSALNTDVSVGANGSVLQNAHLSAFDDGSYVVAWEAVDTADVYLRVVSSNGQFASIVGGYASGDNETLEVAVLDNNTIGLTFERSGVIYASVLNPDITNTAGAFTLNVPGSAGSLPSIAALSDGGFVVTWHTDNGVGTAHDIKAQIINADSTVRSSILDVNTTTLHDQEVSEVVGLSGGGFVVVWQSSQGGLDVTDPNADYDIMARIFDANGVEVVGEFRLNDQTANVQSLPDIAATADGGFTVTWQTNDGVNDPDGFGIVSRSFDANGVAVDFGGSGNGGTASSGEAIVNTITDYDQLEPSITVLADGTKVIVWTTETVTEDRIDVMARMFDANGVALGDEFVVNANVVGDRTEPDVQALSTGGFVVGWTNVDSAGSHIITRVFDASGTATSGEMEIGSAIGRFSDLGALDNGHYVVAWELADERADVYLAVFDGDGQIVSTVGGYTAGDNDTLKVAVLDNNTIGLTFERSGVIYASVLNPDITNTAGAFTLNVPAVDGAGSLPSLAALSDGGFVVTWHAETGSGVGANNDVKAQIINADSTLRSGILDVNTTLIHDQEASKVAGLSDGGFVVVWQSSQGGLDVTDPNADYDIMARIFDANGVEVVGEFRLNDQTTNVQSLPDIAATADGGFTVTWQTNDGVNDPDGFGIVSRTFDADGVAVDAGGSNNNGGTNGGGTQPSETASNTITAYDQLEPAITVLADGTTVIVWTSQTGTGNGFDVMARMFDADGVALGDEFVVNANAVGDQTQPDVQALSTGGFVVAWTGGNQILTRTYDASGSALNTDVSVGANGSVLQNAHLSAFDDGSYVVAWEAVDTADVYLRVVSSNGQFASIVGGYASGDNETLEVAVLDNNTIGLTFERSGVIYASVLNPDITNTAGAFTLNVPGSAGSLPSIAALSDGGFVVTWHTDNGVGTAHDIKAQIINADSTVRSSILDVNTTTLHDQEVSEVVGLSGGGFVVVWQSSQGGLDVTDPNADYDIMARIFDANGVEVVGEFRLNDQTANVQSLPDIAATADGGFTVTWQTNDGVNDPDGFGIVSRSFDANGVAVDFGGSGNGGTASSGEAIVNTITDYDQLEPSITVLADGTKVIVWTTETVTEDRIDVMARMFDANGVALGDEFVVNANVVGDRTEPDVQALSTGGFVVGWTNVDSAGSHIITRVFDASGTATSGEMEIGSAIGRFSDLGALDNGHYVVAWELADERADVYLAVFDGDGQIVSTVGGYTAGDNDTLKVAVLDNNTIGLTFERSGVIYASVLNPDITNTAGAFTLNVPAVDGAGSLPSLAALSDGGFVVTWHAETGSGVGANNDVKAQIINADSTLRSGILDVNTTLIHDQEASKVAGLSDGGFVVVWQSSQGGLDVTDPNADYDIMARIFDANGVEVVGEFRLNDQTTNVQSLPDIAATADGGFTVTWQTNDGVNDPDGFGIVSRTFDADGVAVDAGGSNNNGGTNGGGTQPSETASNTITAYDQLEPAITVLADGTTVIVWTSQTGTGNGFDVMARMFDADGVALGDEFVVNANAVGDQTQPDVQALSTGGFVVAWTGGNQILTRTYDASGSALNTDVSVGANGSVLQNAHLSAFDDGSYVVAWEAVDTADVYLRVVSSNGQFASIVGGYASGDNETLEVAVLDNNTIGLTFERSGVIYASVLNPDITNTAGAFTLNVPGSAGSLPSIAALSDGGFVVTWHTDNGVGTAHDIKAQIINADSTVRSSILDVNTTTLHDQEVSEVVGLSGGGFVVVWQSSQGGLDVTDPNADYDIMARIFDANGVEVVGEFRLNDQTANVQSLPDIAATADGGFTVTWQTNDGVNDPDGFGIVSRSFDANGVAVDFGGSGNGGTASSGEAIVNTITDYDQLEPSITVLADGTKVIVWTTETVTEDRIDVMARMFDANGVALGDEFVVNANVVGDRTEPDVQALSTGGFVVGWTNVDSAGSHIITRVFDASGTATSGEMEIGSAIGRFSDLGALDNGHYVVAWELADERADVYLAVFDGDGQIVSTVGGYTAGDNDTLKVAVLDNNTIGLTFERSGVIYASVLNPDITNTAGAFTLNVPAVDGAGSLPSLAALSDGGFVVTWHAETGSGVGANNDVKAQIINADSTLRSGILDVNTTLIHDQEASKVAGLSDGGFVVVWQSSQGGLDVTDPNADYDIMARIFDANGVEVVGEFRLNDQTTNVQSLPDIAATADGGFTVTWQTNDGVNDPDGFGIVSRTFDADGAPLIDYVMGSQQNDTFFSTGRNEVFTGGDGDDTFVFSDNGSYNTITDFIAGGGTEDTLDLAGVAGLADFADVLSNASDDGSNTLITLDQTGSVKLIGVVVADLSADDFEF